MSELQRVIARLLTDNEFRARVLRHGTAALLEYNLTADELSAILQLNLEQWNSGTTRNPPDGPLTIDPHS
jgi:hypothetical protein